MRDDITNNLVHLTKGTGDDPEKHRGEALKTLNKILKEKTIRGGNGFIKGNHTCVCFSESPISKISSILAQKETGSFKYQPYGIMASKRWIFEKGGRPVIYGPDYDYYNLPEEMRYRHVRFWLNDNYSIDHTWEREWRIKTDQLPITENDVTIVVPCRMAKEALMTAGHKEWHYIVLSDLGIDISPI